MIACYCRVSSDSQKHESQKEEIRRSLKGNRIKLSEVTWYEDTESGTAARRSGLEARKKAIFGGEVDTIVFWKLDRTSRDMRAGINLLADWCERGLRVVSVTVRNFLKTGYQRPGALPGLRLSPLPAGITGNLSQVGLGVSGEFIRDHA